MESMTVNGWSVGGLMLALGLAAGGCAPGALAPDELGYTEEYTDEEEAELETLSQGLVAENGLVAINGLTSQNGLISTNGLIALNGLTTENGLKSTNGLITMNGLATRNGLTTKNGLYVDCQGRTSSQCSGMPDGLLSMSAGLMKSAEGVITAGYVVRCALPASTTISIKDYNNSLVSLPGQLGVAPEWATGSCSQACEEKMTACLLALINQNGVHRSVNLTAAWSGNPLGLSHTDYNVVESAFFGNIFKSPAQAYVVSGYDHARTVADVERGLLTSNGLQLRSCAYAGRNARTYSAFIDAMPGCSAINIGTFTARSHSWSAVRPDSTKYEKCSWADGGYGGEGSRSTAGVCSGPGTSTRTWNYPITAWRRLNPWLAL